jgi:hypothetical protein
LDTPSGYAMQGFPNNRRKPAEAARDFVMGELVTKADLQTTVQNAVQLLEAKIAGAQLRLDTRIDALETKIDTPTLRLTVRLGGLLAAGIAILAAIQKLV